MSLVDETAPSMAPFHRVVAERQKGFELGTAACIIRVYLRRRLCQSEPKKGVAYEGKASLPTAKRRLIKSLERTSAHPARPRAEWAEAAQLPPVRENKNKRIGRYNMGYHLHGSQLRVFRKYVRQNANAELLKKSRIILLEHVLPTTGEMIHHLTKVGADVFALVAKPYSIDAEVLSSIKNRGISVIEESYDTLETSDILDRLINDAVEKSKEDGRCIIILDVGGYFALPLSRISDEAIEFIAGVVEDTTFGHNRYIEHASIIKVPIYSVARSNLKEIEARFVGRDAVYSMDYVLRKIGVTIAGRNALVIGYGMIGKNVARTLKAADLNVSVYDKHDNKNLHAFIDGYHIHKKRELLKNADIIFSATGDPSGAMNFEEIEETKDNVILASVGSKDSEFDIKTLKEQANRRKEFGPYLEEYRLPHSRHVVVAKGGAAVNFIIPSLPIEILDLVFSEILLCSLLLLRRDESIRKNVVNVSPDKFLDEVALDWLRFVNT